jgi:ABC-type multidrug transport system fused ATPase/permease subunit
MDFVNALPNGIYTIVGERGLQLSGGQRQRLGIARALYADPELLVFDEATSALDAESEFAISETLIDLSKQKTVIVVAHRLSTVKRADRIYFWENGEILASGTFEELRAINENFAVQAGLLGL